MNDVVMGFAPRPDWRDLDVYWGKTNACGKLSVARHGFDVAACGAVIFDGDERLARDCERRLGWSPACARAVIARLLALHDIGKFASNFQAKAPAFWPGSELGSWSASLAQRGPRHPAMSEWLMRRLWREGRLVWLAGWDEDAVETLISPFAWHHGAPDPIDERDLSGHRGEEIAPSAALRAVGAFASIVDETIAAEPPPEPELDGLRTLSWRFAGLAVAADWLGSNATWFSVPRPQASAATAWSDACQRAERAVAGAGLGRAPAAAYAGFRALTGVEARPSAAQNWADGTPLGDGPHLAILEDVAGGGKTEAALALAHRLMAAGKGDGLYFALPTMATANAAFERLRRCYTRMFDGAASLGLAHSARALHEGFREVRLAGAGGSSEGDDEALDGAAACAAWIADDAKKTFFAQAAVGTIDQALLAVLPARHQALRLHGLARRVLIVDEAHAYDPYMNEELCALLQFHATLGGSAIVLSATLPRALREKLTAAFERGRIGRHPRASAAPLRELDPYPYATMVSSAGLRAEAVEARPDLRRYLAVERIDDAAAALARIRDEAAAGRAVAWVRNSVDDVIEAARALEAAGVAVEIFHARFALCDRLARESEITTRFGKASDAATRRGRVLVASQVVEQSLDLDFDLMLTDLAPIDLLLQRAGRVCRHQRGPRPGPRLVVLSPEPVDDPMDDWFAGPQPRAAAIYKDHALLWRTARVLFERPRWAIPEDLRALIERVYDDDAPAPPGLERRTNEAKGEAAGEASMGRLSVLRCRRGYGGQDGALWRSESRVQTRLGEPRDTLRLALARDGAVVPFCADPDPARAWALSEASVPKRWGLDEDLTPVGLEAAARAARASWGRFDDEKRLIVLQESNAREWRVKDVLAYSERYGLER